MTKKQFFSGGNLQYNLCVIFQKKQDKLILIISKSRGGVPQKRWGSNPGGNYDCRVGRIGDNSFRIFWKVQVKVEKIDLVYWFSFLQESVAPKLNIFLLEEINEKFVIGNFSWLSTLLRVSLAKVRCTVIGYICFFAVPIGILVGNASTIFIQNLLRHYE